MIELDPKDLSPALRARLRQAIEDEGAARPIFAVEDPGARPWKLTIGLGIVGLLLVVAAVTADYGSPAEWREDAEFIPFYAAMFFLIGVPVLVFARGRWINRRLPFRAGTYVFARDLLIARAGRLRLLSIEDASWSCVRDPYTPTVTLTNELGTFTFDERRVHHERDRIAEARRDPQHPHDPFQEERPSAHLARGSSNVPPPEKGRLWWAGLALGTLVVAAPFWWIRNIASDEAAWATLRRDPTDVVAYERSEGAHRDEAARDVEPRLHLRTRLAHDATSLAARGWLARYPSNPWAGEARAQLDGFVEAEAKLPPASNQIPAYRQFLFENEDHPAEVAALRAKRHAWVQSTAGAAPTRWAALLGYLEANEFPAVRARLHARPPTRLEQAERDIRAQTLRPGYTLGETSALVGEAARARNEDAWSLVLARAFDAAAPGGIVVLRTEDATGDPAPPAPLAQWTADQLDDEVDRRHVGPKGYASGDPTTTASYGGTFASTLGPRSPLLDVTYEFAPKPESLLLHDRTAFVEPTLVVHVELSGFGDSSVAFDATFESKERSYNVGSATHREFDEARAMFDSVTGELFAQLAARALQELKK